MLQIVDLVFIVGGMAAMIVYWFLIRRKISKCCNVFPNPCIYSLAIDRDNLPMDIKSEEFSGRFLNNDNIIQTALTRDFKGLISELDKIYEADRKVKQMEIDLSPEAHPLKQPKSLFYRP